MVEAVRIGRHFRGVTEVPLADVRGRVFGRFKHLREIATQAAQRRTGDAVEDFAALTSPRTLPA